MNKVFLVGNIGKMGKVNYTGKNISVLNISLATNKYWTDESGERKNKTIWHNLVFWGKTADIISDKCSDGDKLSIVGEIDTQKWTSTENGEEFENIKTVIVVQEFDILSSKKRNSKIKEKGE